MTTSATLSTKTFIPGWTSKPFSTLALSASGVLALADLQTIAQRTALSGGASWIDTFLLAPGIHYQQAADELYRKGQAGPIIDVVDELAPSSVVFKLHNAATANYIQKVAKPGETVTLDVGRAIAGSHRYKLHRSDSGKHATAWKEGGGDTDLGWISHALYLMGPLLTITAIGFIVVFKDWWALTCIFGLMLSRILNIWVIKQRAAKTPKTADACIGVDDNASLDGRGASASGSSSGGSNPPKQRPQSPSRRNRTRGGRMSFSGTRERISQFIVRITDAEQRSIVRLRGKASHIKEITSQRWLRKKTSLEGYFEAAGKLLVYLVAAFSGNMTQVGGFIMMCLLLISAGLLALSNSKAKKIVVNGLEVAVAENRVSVGTQTSNTSAGNGAGGAGNGGQGGQQRRGPGNGPAGPRPGPKRDPRDYTSTGVGTNDRGRPVQGSGAATGAMMGSNAAGPSGTNAGRNVNTADLAERGQVGGVRWEE
ncbi:uncharacterized protein C8A04DRAFT_27309 [Dichotomopilus funicola]|uniref:Uncharacterized protein n=1 Tax=Dichotomopilus funicola TaxID=1934379 RepID=A0AAN6ZPB4_9PEZI|nr:hypothetical protein C8A04DRAFT_27309 [Dichotomopilus funicola]